MMLTHKFQHNSIIYCRKIVAVNIRLRKSMHIGILRVRMLEIDYKLISLILILFA